VETGPTVSVVLPVWNGERFLAEAVDSVLSQTLEDIELLLVDDGSTDATVGIAEGFASRDGRVRVVRMTRSGIAYALNAGIARARGRYVARMDADDICRPTRLQRQVAWLDAHPGCVALGSAVEVIDETGEHLGWRTFPESHADISYALIHRWSAALAHPTVVTRRDVLLQVGGYRPDRVPSEDLDLWIRLSEVGTLANINEQLLRYRRHRGAVSVRKRGEQFTTSLRIVNDARRLKGLAPLARRILSPGRCALAMYHFECARTALMMGPRAAAIRHARASIASDPTWPEPWIALAACAFPKWTLRSLLGLSERFRPLRL